MMTKEECLNSLCVDFSYVWCETSEGYIKLISNVSTEYYTNIDSALLSFKGILKDTKKERIDDGAEFEWQEELELINSLQKRDLSKNESKKLTEKTRDKLKQIKEYVEDINAYIYILDNESGFENFINDTNNKPFEHTQDGDIVSFIEEEVLKVGVIVSDGSTYRLYFPKTSQLSKKTYFTIDELLKSLGETVEVFYVDDDKPKYEEFEPNNSFFYYDDKNDCVGTLIFEYNEQGEFYLKDIQTGFIEFSFDTALECFEECMLRYTIFKKLRRD